MSKIIALFESKAFDVALLTAIAAAGAVFGFNVPVGTIMMILTPLMVAAGVGGWTDAVQMKAKMALHHEVKMHALNQGLVTHQELLEGKPVPAPRVGNAQAGFAKVGVMAMIVAIGGTLALGSTMLATNEGCGSVKPVVTDVIHCAQAEATVVSSGYSLIQIAMEVIAAVQKGPAGIEAAIQDLISKYGGDIVACVLDNYPEPTPSAAGSGSGSAEPMSAAPPVLAKRQALQKFFAGKKIDHSSKK